MFVLEDLWLGNINPGERTYRNDTTLGKNSDQLAAIAERIIELLPPEEKDLCERYFMLHADIASEESCDAFIRGFRMGAQMILDVIGPYDSPLYGPDRHK